MSTRQKLPPPVTTGKYRDRLLREAMRYKDGQIEELELLARIDAVIDLIVGEE